MIQLSQGFNLIVFQSVLRAWNKFGQFCESNCKNKTQRLLLCNEYVIKLLIVKKIAGSEEDQREHAESPDLFSSPLEEKENPARKKVHLTLFLKIQFCVAWVLV